MPSPPPSVPLSAPDAPVPFFKRAPKSKSIRKRPATPPSDDSSDYSSSDETKPIKKRRNLNQKSNAVTTTSVSKPSSTSTDSAPVARTYAPDASRTLTSANDATATNWHNEITGYTSPPRKPLDSSTSAVSDEPPVADGTYKGASSYGNFIKKSKDAPARTVGPMKAPSNIRSITVTDYAPDVCKDYKQTGFCGFGDTCKFLHAREDYAQGWKLDRDWEIQQKSGGKAKKQEDAEDDDEWKELKDIPFACVICKKDYKEPIVTKCSHYFCESCAIGRYRKNPGCAICGKRTDGVFNVAKGLRKKLQRKKEREDEKKKEEEEANKDK
ncbi:uncharacterized protein H6S33_006447 [Morchella sextelata]|uniref:uncharacterized protein n=1 Tax=Morchella sextelata TaxID=1174677 RepID=UPI001D05A401|nr:uncharacterized protein H6S33_006447 [Morchella sextelata]KAH0604779.1 hypothetical protein H6S33_006447 [Morchella sextelata]